MPKVIISEEFVEATAEVYSERVFNDLYRLVEMLEALPELGSTELPLPYAIKKRFGKDCRKIVIAPFDILYRYDKVEDTVYVAALIHQRRVH